MKFFTNKKVTQKIIIALVTVIVMNFCIPIKAQANWFTDVSGDLLQELVLLLDALGDIVMGALNKFMLGTEKIYDSAMLEQGDINLSNKKSSLYAKDGIKSTDVKADIPEDFEPDGLLWTDWRIPNFLYCPENIFSNKIAALDVNFINSHKYSGVEFQSDGKTENQGSKEKKESAAGGHLGTVISSWYKAFRNLAVVGLLIVLLYIGIRIMISSTAVEKSKYKQNLYDWLVALCLVVVIHFIMAGIMMFTDSFTNLLSNSVNKSIYVNYDGTKFRTNLTGYVRFMAQSADFSQCTAYTVMYLALVIYTCMFTFTYFKRFLYMAFFTMIAPLVALTYPIDKLKDGKAQAFDLWFKEYTMNAIIQPIHLILYTVFVGGAMDIAMKNPIYAIVAIGFLTPAEKFIKKMFGVESQTTSGGLGEIAGGALAMKGIQQVVGQLKGGKGKQNGESESGTGNNVLKTRGANPTFKTDPMSLIAGGSNSGGSNSGGVGQEGSSPRGANSDSTNPQEQSSTEQNSRNDDSRDSNDDSVEKKIAEEKAKYESMGIHLGDEHWQNRREQLTKENAELQSQHAEQEQEGQEQETPDILSAGTEPPSRWQNIKSRANDVKDRALNTRFAKGTGAVASLGARKIKRAPAAALKSLKSGTYKVAKGIPTGLAKTIPKVGGAAAVATMAGVASLGAAVTTGDFSKGLSMVSGAVGLGAGAGAAVGGSLGTNVANKVSSGMDEMKQAYTEGAYTKQELKEKKQREFDREWKNNEENYKYLRSQGLKGKDADEFLNSRDTQKYLDAGITDIKLIHNASKLAKDEKYDIDHAVARAKLASEYSDSFNRNEQNAFRKSIMDENPNVTNEMATKLIDDIKVIKGLK